MNISSNHLRAFFELAQERNFTRAAEQLAITQSAFSTRILNLERDLETRLFIREKANVRLTEAGEKLLRYCEKLKRLEDETLGEISTSQKGELVGTVRIGGFSSVLRSALLPSLAELMRCNPKLSLSMLSVELKELLGLMKTSKVDFVLSTVDPKISAIRAELLGYETNVLVESKKYGFNGIYLDHDADDQTTHSYFQLRPELEAKSLRRRYLDDVYGLIDGVKLGYGRAVLPLHLIRNEKDLKVLYPRTQLKIPIYLLYYENPYYTTLEKAVIEALQNHFSFYI